MIFTGMSLKVFVLLLGSSLMIFFPSCWNSRKVNFFAIKMMLNLFLTDWFLNCLCRCFKYLSFRVEDVFFNFRILFKFVNTYSKYLNDTGGGRMLEKKMTKDDTKGRYWREKLQSVT